jgi:hypothetical protein
MNLEPIDTSTTAGKARVMQLAAEGRKVARRSLRIGGIEFDTWYPDEGDAWNWLHVEYAIIAEPVGPKEVLVIVADNGHAQSVWEDMEAADNVTPIGWHIVKYRRADLAGRDE